mmetsp:Transcript_85703/g.239535  ORF Transcript_85703/g.239535 Transcript_85703/m.239535 type:complete len:952 (-) Transcript_85703:88-2943(-)
MPSSSAPEGYPGLEDSCESASNPDCRKYRSHSSGSHKPSSTKRPHRRQLALDDDTQAAGTETPKTKREDIDTFEFTETRRRLSEKSIRFVGAPKMVGLHRHTFNGVSRSGSHETSSKKYRCKASYGRRATSSSESAGSSSSTFSDEFPGKGSAEDPRSVSQSSTFEYLRDPVTGLRIVVPAIRASDGNKKIRKRRKDSFASRSSQVSFGPVGSPVQAHDAGSTNNSVVDLAEEAAFEEKADQYSVFWGQLLPDEVVSSSSVRVKTQGECGADEGDREASSAQHVSLPGIRQLLLDMHAETTTNFFKLQSKIDDIMYKMGDKKGDLVMPHLAQTKGSYQSDITFGGQEDGVSPWRHALRNHRARSMLEKVTSSVPELLPGSVTATDSIPSDDVDNTPRSLKPTPTSSSTARFGTIDPISHEGRRCTKSSDHSANSVIQEDPDLSNWQPEHLAAAPRCTSMSNRPTHQQECDNVFALERRTQHALLDGDGKFGGVWDRDYAKNTGLDFDRGDFRPPATNVVPSGSAEMPLNGDLMEGKSSVDLSVKGIGGVDSLLRDHDDNVARQALTPRCPMTLTKHTSGNSSMDGSADEHEEDQRKSAMFRLVHGIMLRACGVVPMRPACTLSFLYQNFVLLVTAFTAVYPIFAAADDSDGAGTRMSHVLSGVFLSLGGVFGLLLLRMGPVHERYLCLGLGPLELYAKRNGFLRAWSKRSAKRFFGVMLLWFCAVILRVASSTMALGLDMSVQGDFWFFCCFIIGSITFATVLCCQLHLLGILEMAVDHFCFAFLLSPDVGRALGEWNSTQAILRLVARAFDWCFLWTQTNALCALVTSVTLIAMLITGEEKGDDEGSPSAISLAKQLFPLLPLLFLVLGAGALQLFGAVVTEKCIRVPALLNAVIFDNEDRGCIVQYITNSSAGFYVKEVRVTAAMALKLAYIVGFGTMAVLMRVVAAQF